MGGRPTQWAVPDLNALPENHRKHLTLCSREVFYIDVDIATGISPYGWISNRRAQLIARINAICLRLCGIQQHEVDYIIKNFPIVKRKHVATYGMYRTKDRILTIYDEIAECIAEGSEWVSPLDPPPGDPRAAWTEEEMEMWRAGKGDELVATYGILQDAEEPDDSDSDSESGDPADTEAEAVE